MKRLFSMLFAGLVAWTNSTTAQAQEPPVITSQVMPLHAVQTSDGGVPHYVQLVQQPGFPPLPGPNGPPPGSGALPPGPAGLPPGPMGLPPGPMGLPPGPASQVAPQIVQPDSVLGPNGANCCNNSCGGGGHWYAGVGAYYIAPIWNNNGAYSRSSGTVGGDVKDFRYDLDIAPRVWVGYDGGNGLGFRARAWFLDTNDTETLSVTGVAGALGTTTSARPFGLGFSQLDTAGVTNAYKFESSLRMQVIDAEMTRSLYTGLWNLNLTGGARYAFVKQNYDAYFNNATTSQSLQSHNTFQGAGPTLALETNRKIASSCWSFYGSARGSLLVGAHDAQANGSSTVAGVTTLTSGSSSNYDVIPVLELEAGVEWTRNMGAWQPFVQLGLVGQTWFGVGNSSGTTGNGDRGDQNLNLVGFNVSAGIRY